MLLVLLELVITDESVELEEVLLVTLPLCKVYARWMSAVRSGETRQNVMRSAVQSFTDFEPPTDFVPFGQRGEMRPVPSGQKKQAWQGNWVRVDDPVPAGQK